MGSGVNATLVNGFAATSSGLSGIVGELQSVLSYLMGSTTSGNGLVETIASMNDKLAHANATADQNWAMNSPGKIWGKWIVFLRVLSCCNVRAHSGPEMKKALNNKAFSVSVGGAEEDRTPDLRIANATLSQLSYRPNEAKILAQGTVEASAAANGTGGPGQTTT